MRAVCLLAVPSVCAAANEEGSDIYDDPFLPGTVHYDDLPAQLSHWLLRQNCCWRANENLPRRLFAFRTKRREQAEFHDPDR
jgi:hypothetical protein